MTLPASCDLLVIGGGINGAAIARDAAGRGLKVVLAERGDLACGTSQASSKLIHGGLRYLEHYYFRLVQESLAEREVLLRTAPHLVRPLTFLLPWSEGLRPIWMLRLGMALYDRLGGRSSLPRSKRIRLRRSNLGRGLQNDLTFGFTYSDCWVDDARFVVAMARDAAAHGATILTRTTVDHLEPEGGGWKAALRGQDGSRTLTCRLVVNACGIRVGEVAAAAGINRPPRVRLVKGSHIVVPRVHAGEHALILQNRDERIVFVLPFEEKFSLIGTTETPIDDPAREHEVDDSEIDYLLSAVRPYLKQPLGPDDVVWSFAGTRPLKDEGEDNPSAASRDYALDLAIRDGAAMLNIVGGKITTARKLAEAAMTRLAPLAAMGGPWTATSSLPGGTFESLEGLVGELQERHAGISARWIERLALRHGSDSREILGEARVPEDLGEHYGAGLTEREVAWLIEKEWARTAEDVLWRRTKCGLQMSPEQHEAIARRLAS
ncbi:MAG: glycerol-3-phosphate dehydrogenase [Proteobacteria bacterium]|nr:glycerol-3-phosphate dehydrogenase [Pseudomonadota bacterium]MDA1070300.1 glycerol-3-phosphate dehydrogenase [Pseudomonadota bacterium]